jgi:hypothetical protein
MSHVATNLDKELKECTVKVAIGSGLWKSVFEYKRHNNGSWPSGSQGGEYGEFLYNSPLESEGKSHVTISHSIDSEIYQSRLIAIDTDGNEVKPFSRKGAGTGNFWQTAAIFDMPLEKIESFCVQTRKYEWFELKDVSLRPKAKKKSKAAKIGFFDRKTLVKFESKGEPTGTRRTKGNIKTYSKSYDVVFRKGEKLLVFAELYQLGKPMRRLGHRIFDGSQESQELSVKLTEKTNKQFMAEGLDNISYQVQVEIGKEKLNVESVVEAPNYADTAWGFNQQEIISREESSYF